MLKDLNLLSHLEVIEKESIYLPLYSYKNGKKYVYEKSGLNQWNAGGRKRNSNEIYIPHPSLIKNKFPNFFPERHIPFDLILPNDKVIKAKICQDNDKALMSNPNEVLGEWLLRDVLNVPENKLIVIRDLEILNIDSVIVTKESASLYSINFTKTDSYEEFIKDI